MTDTKNFAETASAFTFYHSIFITAEFSTPGWPAAVPIVENALKVLRTLDLEGKRILDIGCRDGAYSFEAEKLGAAEVIGFDNDLTPGVNAWLVKQLGSKIRFENFNLLDLRPETFGFFDVVLFPGVLYHLRFPFYALDLINRVLKPGGNLLIETGILVGDENRPLLYCPVGKDSPYEATSCTFFNRKGLKDTMQSLGFTLTQDSVPLNLSLGAPPPVDGVTVIDRWAAIFHKEIAKKPSDEYRYWQGERVDPFPTNPPIP